MKDPWLPHMALPLRGNTPLELLWCGYRPNLFRGRSKPSETEHASSRKPDTCHWHRPTYARVRRLSFDFTPGNLRDEIIQQLMDIPNLSCRIVTAIPDLRCGVAGGGTDDHSARAQYQSIAMEEKPFESANAFCGTMRSLRSQTFVNSCVGPAPAG